MAVEVKHPLDSASTDLLEVSRHRLEPLSTKMEERDADVMKVSMRRVSLTIAFIDSSNKTADTFFGVNSFFAIFFPSRYEVLFALFHFKMSILFVRDAWKPCSYSRVDGLQTL